MKKESLLVTHIFEPLENCQTKKPAKILLSTELIFVGSSSYTEVIKLSFSMVFRLGGLLGGLKNKYFPPKIKEKCDMIINVNDKSDLKKINVKDLKSIRLVRKKLSHRIEFEFLNGESLQAFKVLDPSRVTSYEKIFQDKYGTLIVS